MKPRLQTAFYALCFCLFTLALLGYAAEAHAMGLGIAPSTNEAAKPETAGITPTTGRDSTHHTDSTAKQAMPADAAFQLTENKTPTGNQIAQPKQLTKLNGKSKHKSKAAFKAKIKLKAPSQPKRKPQVIGGVLLLVLFILLILVLIALGILSLLTFTILGILGFVGVVLLVLGLLFVLLFLGVAA